MALGWDSNKDQRGILFGASRALKILGAFIVAQLVGAIIVIIPIQAYYTPRISDAQQLAHDVQSIATIPSALLGTAFGMLLMLRMTRRSLPGPLASGALSPVGWTGTSVRTLAIAASIGLTLSLLVVFVLVPLFPPTPEQASGYLSQAAATPGLVRFGWAILAVCIAPPVEEFLFRGVLLAGFARSWGPGIAATVVTSLFVVLHMVELQNYWPGLAGIALMAIAALEVRRGTGSLGPAIALHAAYNLVPVVAVYVAA